MKTTKKSISLELPASLSALTDGLDLEKIHPELVSADHELFEAHHQLEALRDDIQQGADRVAALAVTDDAVGHSREFHRWQAAKARVPMVQARVQRAEAALSEAKQNAAVAAMAEARRRHEVLLAAVAQLAAALKEIQGLEDALNVAIQPIPTAPGAGIATLSTSVRETAIVTAVAV